jgi:hypothetical protein
MRSASRACLVTFGLFFLALPVAMGGEMVALSTPTGTMRGEVVRVTASEVVLKDVGGKERSFPLVMLKPREVYLCRKQLTGDEDAKARYDLGEYCLKSNLRSEAEVELGAAARIDGKTYKEKVDALLKSTAAPEPPKTTRNDPPKADPAAKTDTAKKDPPKQDPPKKEETAKAEHADHVDSDGELVDWVAPDGRHFKIPKKFVSGAEENIKPRTDAEVKKFIADQLEALKKNCSSGWKPTEKPRDWTMEETAHFYVFSNMRPDYQAFFKKECEDLYKLLCDVLEHKEGEPLWNNKCPLYLLSNQTQFRSFAAAIEGNPAAANSGGYFSHRGRECHIVIPLVDWMSEKEQMRTATNTLRHEGTHAFLQLTGKNVPLSRWIHEGMAQFIQFWYDPNNNPDRNRLVSNLRQQIGQGSILSWEEGRMRPGGGTDELGYAFAYSRLLFLYQAFLPDKRKLPTMINLIKSGKTEDQAIEEAYGKKPAELERVWENWLKEQAKRNFRM